MVRATHPLQCIKPIRVTFRNLSTPSSGIPPVPIHHESHMTWNRPERDDKEEESGEEGVETMQNDREDVSEVHHPVWW